MPGPEFFTRLGLFTMKGFFDVQDCARLRAEMRSRKLTQTTLVDGYTTIERAKEDVRKGKQAEVSAATTSLVEQRLAALVPELKSHFHLPLVGCEKPQFLVYNAGDFFLPHKDGEDKVGKPSYIRKRLLSAVIFLNGESKEPEFESYSGGSLIFYGLIDDPLWKKYGFALTSEAGLIVAFHSDVLHEVTAVIRGDRYSIVSWYF